MQPWSRFRAPLGRESPCRGSQQGPLTLAAPGCVSERNRRAQSSPDLAQQPALAPAGLPGRLLAPRGEQTHGAMRETRERPAETHTDERDASREEKHRRGPLSRYLYWVAGVLAASNIFFRPSIPDMASTFFLQSPTSTGRSCREDTRLSHAQTGGPRARGRVIGGQPCLPPPPIPAPEAQTQWELGGLGWAEV